MFRPTIAKQQSSKLRKPRTEQITDGGFLQFQKKLEEYGITAKLSPEEVKAQSPTIRKQPEGVSPKRIANLQTMSDEEIKAIAESYLTSPAEIVPDNEIME